MTSFNASETIAFVTGSNRERGIGRAIVDALLAAGARKVYAAARDTAQLAGLAAAHGDRVVPMRLDVTDQAQIAAAVAAAGDVNLLVNNAGVFTAAGALENPDGARLEMDVNYFGPMHLTREFAPVLAQNGGGAVVNINSISSHMNFPLGGTYSASKAAAHSLTQAQRRDLAPHGTHVIGVYPGPIDTEMADDVEMEKVSAAVVADAVLAALRNGETDEVYPDPMAQGMHAQWREDPRAVERELTAMAAEAAG